MHSLQTNNQNFINKSKTIYNFITDIDVQYYEIEYQ